MNERLTTVETRLEIHEKQCTERQGEILKRLSRMEKIILIGGGVVAGIVKGDVLVQVLQAALK